MFLMARKAKRPRSETDQGSDDKDLRFQEDCVANPTVKIQEEEEAEEEEEEILLSEGYSTSFSGSMCGSYDDDVNGDEAQSVLRRDSSSPEIDKVLCMNKKEPTEFWKEQILTIFWRCKWLEIKTKEMASQARYYDEEARRCDEAKDSDVEGTSSTSGNGTRRLYERKRRKRVEATKDIGAYRAKHNIFSYAEKRRVGARKVPILDFDYDPSQQVKDYKEESDEESRFPSLFAQDPLEKILHKIYKVQEKATKLKNIVNRFVPESQNEQCEEKEEEEEEEVHVIPTLPEHTEEDRPRNQSQMEGQILSRPSMFPAFSIEDMLIDEAEMIVLGTKDGEEKFNLLMEGLNRFTLVPEEEDDDDET